MEITVGKNTENPFQGLKYCLEVYQQGGKGEVNSLTLNRAWEEVKGDLRKRQMFFSLLFSIGDITARQHNIFKGDVIEKGGNAQREAFMIILEWLRKNSYMQYVTFLHGHLINEYVSFDTLLANRVKTSGRKKAKVERVYNSLSIKNDDLVEYCATVIKGNNETEKYFLAKYLSRPRTSKRSKSKKMLTETKSVMRDKVIFYEKLSKKLGFQVNHGPEYVNFVGLNEWKKKYNQDLESVLFSSKKILTLDKQEFLEYLEKLPSSARFRVRCRVLTSDNKIKPKWSNLGTWFLEWENFKKTKQAEVRVLEEKVRQGASDDDTILKLEKAKKEAKVTTGAINFQGMFKDIVQGTVDEVKLQPFLDKIKLPYNTLVFVDDSGSMSSTSSNYGFTAFDFASFMATICLIKNPEDSGRDLIGYFSKQTRMFTGIDVTEASTNRILSSVATPIPKGSLIQPEKSFLENLTRIRNFGKAIRTSNNTNIGSIPSQIQEWVKGDSIKLEMLQRFPVWTIISDGNWNNLSSPEASMRDFMEQCMKYFGYKPFIIAIDVSSRSSSNVTHFSGIENFMFVPPNPAQIEQLLTNFSDFEIMDVYTPLNSLYKSNRYSLVRKFTV